MTTTAGCPGASMDRPALRRFLAGWFCGCGSPEAAARSLLWLLRSYPLYEHRDEFERGVPDNGIAHLLLYTLDRYELTEHGGSVGGGWLTGLGTAVRDALAREEADGFEALFALHCAHGYDVDDQSHDCMADGHEGDGALSLSRGTTVERKRGPARKMYAQCDACGQSAPDVVGPILLGIEGWRTFEIDGEYQGRRWRANVLLCGRRRSWERTSFPRCADKMEAFVKSGGVALLGPRPPQIKTSEGGFYVDPEFLS